MSMLYHLRLDVRKVQDNIFQVAEFKFMIGLSIKKPKAPNNLYMLEEQQCAVIH